MYKKRMRSVAAATVIELAVLTTIVYPQIGAAKRAQTPQIEKRDVVLGSRGDRPVARTDDRAQKALKSPGFKVGLQSIRFGEARAVAGCGRWGCGTNSPIVAGAFLAARPCTTSARRNAPRKSWFWHRTLNPDLSRYSEASLPPLPVTSFVRTETWKGGRK